MTPRSREPKPARTSFFAALILSLLLGRSVRAQQKGVDVSLPAIGGAPVGNVGGGLDAAAINRVDLTVPAVNSAPSAVLPLAPAAVSAGGSVVAGPTPAMTVGLPAASAPAAVLVIPADPNRTDSEAANVLPAQKQRTQNSRNVPAKNDPTPAAGHGAANIDFDGSRGGVSRANVPADGTGGPSALERVSAKRRAPSIRRPYQLALAGLQVPAPLIARLDAFVAASHPNDPSDTRQGLAHTVRTANIVAAMAEAAKGSQTTKRILIFSALLREAALENNPGAAALFGDFENERLVFDKNILEAIIAASDLEVESGKPRRSVYYGSAGLRLWADRWGRRLSFAGEIAAFTGTNAEAMRAAKAEAQASGRPAPSDEEVAAGAFSRLNALMENPFFALVPRSVRANVGEISRFFQSKSGPRSAPAGRVVPRNDTSVEIEVDSDPQILNLLTTPGGTVGGLLGDLPPPDDFAAQHEGKAPQDVAWDSLSARKKLALLQYVTESKKTGFYADRAIPRVSMKKKVVLKFARETTFLGKTYSPGRHLVDVSRVFRHAVEYRGAAEVESVAGVEFHFRDNQSAGKVSNDAWTLLEGLGVQRTHQHVHIVAPLPIEALEREPDVQAAAMGDFYRRVNLMAEMTGIIEERSQVWMRVHGNITLFGYAKPGTMRGVTQYFKDIGAKHVNSALGDFYKIAWVGFRGSDKYDEPGLYGLEYRSIDEDANETNYRETLDRIQQSMMRDDYGIPKERIRRWLAKRGNGANAPDAVAAAWYNQAWPSVFSGATPAMKKTLDLTEVGFLKKWPLGLNAIAEMLGFGRSALAKRLEDEGQDHAELKMLVFDWSNDPLVFEDEALQKRIADQKILALSRFSVGVPVNVLVSEFLVDSGLYDAVSRSMGPASSAR